MITLSVQVWTGIGLLTASQLLQRAAFLQDLIGICQFSIILRTTVIDQLTVINQHSRRSEYRSISASVQQSDTRRPDWLLGHQQRAIFTRHPASYIIYYNNLYTPTFDFVLYRHCHAVPTPLRYLPYDGHFYTDRRVKDVVNFHSNTSRSKIIW